MIEKTKDSPKFREIIRARLNELGWTTYNLVHGAKARGISASACNGFMSGARGANGAMIEQYFDILHLKVVVDKERGIPPKPAYISPNKTPTKAEVRAQKASRAKQK